MFDYDAELRRYHARLFEAVDIDPDARVLDIGCGTGQTTRAAARAASGGDALGVDISAPMLERARRLTNLEGLANARFECGDAQVHPLPAERFTIGLSRFGTMFFADPSAAFANIARALRPDARFVQLAEACEPVYYGADGASALHAIRSLRMTSEPLRDLEDDASTDRALSRLRTIFRARDEGGVWFDSCAWLVTARRG